jgi:peptide/nickel transport system substrate-binding protein
MSHSDLETQRSETRDLSRRKLLQAAGALAAAGAFGGLTVLDVKPAVAQDSTQPVSGGEVMLGYIDEPPTMDPRVSGSAKATNLMVNLFDTLIALDRDTGNLVPGLASSWEGSADATAYTFHLRNDVTFHDGTPFNAEAVKYTFDSIMDPELRSLSAIGALGTYTETEVVDDYTVIVHFAEPYAAFPNMVSASTLAPVSPTAAQAAGPTEFGRAPVGTGPFKFSSWEQQVSMSFERNPDYKWPIGLYKHEGPAYIDKLTVQFIPEAATLTGSIESGQLTIADGILPQDVATLDGDDDFQTMLPTIPGIPQILPLNAAKFPTDDLAVRQAILYGIDTETIVDTIFFGTLKPAKGPLAASTLDYNPAVESYYPYDTDKASQLLADAGWTQGSGGILEKDGQPLHLEYITTPGQPGDVAELVQAYLQPLGFDVNLQILEYAATAELMLAGEHNIARLGYTGTDPAVLTTAFHSDNIAGTNFNRTMLPDPDLDAKLEAAAAETDPDARKQMYYDIQVYIMDRALIIPLWDQAIFWGAQARLQGLYPMSLAQIPFYDAWLAE